MTEDELILRIYDLGKGKPMNVVDISAVKAAAGADFDRLWRRLTSAGLLDDRFAVGQTRLTDAGMYRAEDLAED
jgi:hypothetical protein